MRDALSSWSLVCGSALIAIGASVMVGWFLDVEWLTRIGTGQVTMKFNTAFCLALLGIGIVVGSSTRVALAACTTVGALARSHLRSPSPDGASGSMSSCTRIHRPTRATRGGWQSSPPFACASAWSRCSLCGRVVTVSSTGSALVMLAVGWLGCLGYLFGVRALYDVGDFSTLAAHTAVSMVILAIGLLATSPNGPLPWIVHGDDPGATVLRRILPLALVGVPVIAQATLFGEHAGWYQTELGLAFVVVAASSGVSLVAMHMAGVINRSHTARVARQRGTARPEHEPGGAHRGADRGSRDERGVGQGACRVGPRRDLSHRRRRTVHLRQRSMVRDLRDVVR